MGFARTFTGRGRPASEKRLLAGSSAVGRIRQKAELGIRTLANSDE